MVNCDFKEICPYKKVTSIGIVLAIYNGGNFLEQQLKSIAAQDYQPWVLYARDDVSGDDSLSTVEEFTKQDRRFNVIADKQGNLGAKANFSSLIEIPVLDSHQYIAFSDQDDVWVKDKLSIQMDAMQRLESKFPGSALLVHSDMSVVDASLDMVASSFMVYQGIHHEEEHPLKVLLAQNFVTGCTMLVNRKLLNIALPVPEEALMHDWWLALCAAVFGHIGFVDKPLVKYRQHGNNEVGAKHIGNFLNPMSGKWKSRWLAGRDNLFQSMQQAQVLAERIRQHDPKNPNLLLVEAYASLQQEAPLQRVKKIQQLGVHAQSKIRQALLLSRLMFTGKM